MPGTNDEVKAIADDGDWLYVGGVFTHAGTVHANYIARWNRVTHIWQNLGQGINGGVDGVVTSIGVLGDSVFVGGQFTSAGDVAAENIAVWNKRTGTWSNLGEGTGEFGAYVTAITVDGSSVYVGGRFSSLGGKLTSNIARWDGHEWQRLGAGLGSYCYALTVHAGKLYAGGAFMKAGAADAAHVAVWDGTNWSGFGTGVNGDVYALATGNGNLYAGGSFTKAGDSTTPYVARWDMAKQSWNALRDTNSEIKKNVSLPTIVHALAFRNDSLFVVGQYPMGWLKSTTARAFNFMIWDGEWRDLVSRQDSAIRSINSTRISAAIISRDVLYLGGVFTAAGSQPVSNLVGWDLGQHRWMMQGSGVNGEVTQLLRRGSDLFVAGGFVSAGGEYASKVVRMDASGWHPIGFGVAVAGNIDDGVVAGLIVDAQNVYVAGTGLSRIGDFGRADSPYIQGGAGRWDGTRWTPMSIGNLTEGIGSHPISSLAFSGGKVYGGRASGNDPFSSLIWWDAPGETWRRVEGVYEHTNAIVSDAAGNIFLAGWTGLFRWRPGTITLENLGASDGYLRTVTIDGPRIYVGGDFTKIGNIDANHIAVYDTVTKTWSALGTGVARDTAQPRATVNAIAVSKGMVYAGGLFNRAGAVDASNVAKWDGTAWSALGSGVNGVVRTLASDGDDLYLGGAFRIVGGDIQSWNFAHWNQTQLSVQQKAHVEGLQFSIAAVPNPVQGGTARVDYTIPAAGHIRLSVHDLLGREIAVVADTSVGAGEHSTIIDAGFLPSGIYYCRLQSGRITTTTRLVVAR
jgi:hypothetical protein